MVKVIPVSSKRGRPGVLRRCFASPPLRLLPCCLEGWQKVNMFTAVETRAEEQKSFPPTMAFFRCCRRLHVTAKGKGRKPPDVRKSISCIYVYPVLLRIWFFNLKYGFLCGKMLGNYFICPWTQVHGFSFFLLSSYVQCTM